MKEMGMSLDDSLKLLKSKRSCVNPHQAFLDQLIQFENKLKETKSQNNSPIKYDLTVHNVTFEEKVKCSSIGPNRKPDSPKQEEKSSNQNAKLVIGPYESQATNLKRKLEEKIDDDRDIEVKRDKKDVLN
mmetsp:Transcript_11117/g.16584  ORF Transcript_11117/g.16584 Transcript_11117/m.16584 type:complete len:130 (+) Transcript_11117:385-774(+)